MSQDSHHGRHLGDLLPCPLVAVGRVSPGAAEILQATVEHAGDDGGRETRTAQCGSPNKLYIQTRSRPVYPQILFGVILILILNRQGKN